MLRLSVLLFCGFLWAASPDGIERELDVRIHMRDGVELSANIFRPVAAGRVPTILVRTPYDKGDEVTPNQRAFVVRGYAVVVQDVRGRYDSQGVFEPLRQEASDSEDTLNWIARQGWSNRRIGMMGGSYLGIVQWKSALLNNPYLKAIFPVVAGCDDYFDRFYSAGGALKLGQRLEWMAENLRAPAFAKPDFNRFVLACDAIPALCWLDGVSDGEQRIEELLRVAAAAGNAALTIIPDRNYKPGVPDQKLKNLYGIVDLAQQLRLPITVGTEMNSPGNKFVDAFETAELKPLTPVFLRGAHVACAHAALQREGGRGYLSPWAVQNYPRAADRNAFFEQVGKALTPAREGALAALPPDAAPAQVLEAAGG